MILQEMLDGLPGEPCFNFFSFNDVNPVSGRHKWRAVAAPNDAMKILQRKFLRYIRTHENTRSLNALRYATSSNPGDSPLRNVAFHRNNRFFYLLDFSNAYGSVKAEGLARVLLRLSLFCDASVEELTRFLERYFFDTKQGLVPGGPASQDLFNLYVGSLIDSFLTEVVEKKGIMYTRYIDDLTFSSASPIPGNVRRNIRNPILQAGFSINHRKCEYVDIRKQTVVITGIGLADGGRMFTPRPYIRKIRGIMHRARTEVVLSGQVHGMMATVRKLLQTQDRNPNELEKKVLREYEDFKRLP